MEVLQQKGRQKEIHIKVKKEINGRDRKEVFIQQEVMPGKKE